MLFVRRRCREKGTLLHCRWECKLMQPLWKTVWSFLRKLKIELTMWSSNHTPGHKPRQTMIQRDTCTPVFIVALFIVAKTWEQSECPSTDECIKEIWYIYTMEYKSAIKKNEIIPFSATWMELLIFIISVLSQKEKGKCHVISLLCRI